MTELSDYRGSLLKAKNYRVPLRAPVVKRGAAVDREGAIFVSLENGEVVRIGQ